MFMKFTHKYIVIITLLLNKFSISMQTIFVLEFYFNYVYEIWE